MWRNLIENNCRTTYFRWFFIIWQNLIEKTSSTRGFWCYYIEQNLIVDTF